MKKICLLFMALFLCQVCLANAAQVNKIVAVVNGQPITMHDLRKESAREFAMARVNPTNPAQNKEADAIMRKVLDRMILDILVEQEAKRLKAQVTDSDIDAELARMMQARKLTKAQFKEQLAKQGLSVDQLRKDMGKNMLRQKVMSLEVGRRVVVTPEEIKAYYEAHKGELVNRQGLHMGILVYHPKANAGAIASQIKSGNMTFEEACAKYSIYKNKDKGGDEGPVQWDSLNPEWDARLKKMKPGDVTELFNLQGYKAQVHLFRPGGGEEKQLTLEEATPQIDMILRQPKAKERFEDYSRQLKQKAVIDIRM